MKKWLMFLCTAMLVFAIVGSANAFTIQGSLWTPADASAQNPAIVPAGAAQATFTVDAINFDSTLGTTYQSFLQGGATNVNNLDWTYQASGFDVDSFYTSPGRGTFFQFTGVAYFEANTTFRHDDGFYLTLGDTVYDYSTPTVPIYTSLSNVAGTYAFTLNYGAWNGFPEVLETSDMSAPVPEPATMFLLGTGLVGLAGLKRRKK